MLIGFDADQDCSRVAVAAKAKGVAFVCRYLKNLSVRETRALAAAGLIGEGFVVCDRRLNPDTASAAAPFRLIWGVTGSQPEQGCAWLVTHQAAGSSRRPVSVTRLSVAGARVATEIEADILRNISR